MAKATTLMTAHGKFHIDFDEGATRCYATDAREHDLLVLELSGGRWVYAHGGLQNGAADKSVIDALEKWTKQHSERYIELAQAGIEAMGDRVVLRAEGSVWDLSGSAWDEMSTFLGDVVGTLQVTGGNLHGVDVEVYEQVLDLVTRTAAALAKLSQRASSPARGVTGLA
jgi:hypothetical protein